MTKHPGFFASFAKFVSDWSGKPVAFIMAFTLVIVWAVSGPMFGYSETWQMVINTSTTIVTFLMIFVLQNSQNRDGKAVQAKLDLLILNSEGSNKLVGAEKLDETELHRMSDKLEKDAQVLDRKAEKKSRKRSDSPATQRP